MARSHFWRVRTSRVNFITSEPGATQLLSDSALKHLSPGHGVIVGELDEASGNAHISWVGIVKEITANGLQAEILWKSTNFPLEPTPAGKVYWRKLDWFEFRENVSERYRLDEVFAGLFDKSEWPRPH